MKNIVAIVLVEDGLADQSEGGDQCHMQPQKRIVEWVIATEAATNKAEQENHLQQDTFVDVILLKEEFPAVELGPVFEE